MRQDFTEGGKVSPGRTDRNKRKQAMSGGPCEPGGTGWEQMHGYIRLGVDIAVRHESEG